MDDAPNSMLQLVLHLSHCGVFGNHPLYVAAHILAYCNQKNSFPHAINYDRMILLGRTLRAIDYNKDNTHYARRLVIGERASLQVATGKQCLPVAALA